MLTSHHFTVYSKAATARILDIAVALVKEIRIFANAVWVHIAGRRPTFISKVCYRLDYLESRTDRSTDIRVTPVGAFSYIAYNTSKATVYRLWCSEDLGLQCECKDFEWQKISGKYNPTCKHRIAVNQWLNDKFPIPTYA